MQLIQFLTNSHPYLTALTCLLITIVPYAIFYRLYRFFPLVHPGILSIIATSLLLKMLSLSYDTYLRGVWPLMLFLGPATLSLAVPLFHERKNLRKLFFPIMITMMLSSLIAILSATQLATLFGLPQELTWALSLKSVTSPFALVIAETAQINKELSVLFIIITGIGVAMMGPFILQLMKFKNPQVQGLAMGLAGHGLGTAIMMKKGKGAGPFAALAMALNGPMTAVYISCLIQFLQR